MGIAARNHEIDIKGTTAEISKTMVSEPRLISKLDVLIHFAKNHTPKERKILEAAAHGCPVGRSLHPNGGDDCICLPYLALSLKLNVDPLF